MADDLAFAFPGRLETPTGGYGYARRIIAGLRDLGWRVRQVPLGDGFPAPDAATRTAAERLLLALPAEMPVVVDGLAFGALPEAAQALAGRLVIALVHHPLALESGLSAARAAALAESECAALAAARGVIVSSPATARLLAADYAVASGDIAIVVPGTDPAPHATGGAGPTRLLSVGSLVPRKGHHVLLDALRRLTDLPWRLDIAGSDRLDPECAARLADQCREAGLDDRVHLHGALSTGALETLYSRADLFVLASRYEGYGMAYAEAIARGLPIVATGAGAVAETVGQAGIVLEPHDHAGLEAALRRMIADQTFRAEYAARARAAARHLPDWPATVRAFAAAVTRLAEGPA